jgi:Pet100
MAKGRQGFLLEGWKFGIYLLIPISASIYYNSPQRQKESADYWHYIQYPANPSTGWKEQIELMQSQKAQREVYRQQLQQLQNTNTTNDPDESTNSEQNSKTKTTTSWGWLRYIGLGPKAT